jgi:hypothetical protein
MSNKRRRREKGSGLGVGMDNFQTREEYAMYDVLNYFSFTLFYIGRHIRVLDSNIVRLKQNAHSLSITPSTIPSYTLALYPLTVSRAARLQESEWEEQYSLECIRQAWEEEVDGVREEWSRAMEKVRSRMLEGLEERRRRGREDKDGEGINGKLYSYQL